MNVVTSCGLGLVLATTPLAAQQMPAAPRLEVVARVQASGGQVEKVAIAGDGRHMLTKGAWGDLVWWDVRELRVLGRYEAPADVRHFALHPRESWALVATSDKQGGLLQRLDLETGEWQPQRAIATTALAFDAAGENIAMAVSDGKRRQLQVCTADRLDAPLWQRRWDSGHVQHVGWHGGALSVLSWWPEATDLHWWRVTLDTSDPSSQGMHELASSQREDAAFEEGGEVVALVADRYGECEVEQRLPKPKRWSLRRYTDGWLQEVHAAPDGTLVVTDNVGQLLVLGPGEQVRVTSAHRGAAVGAVWSPDGNFLAVQGLGALLVIDRTGLTVGEFACSHGVAPGDAGGSFVLLDHDRITWWDAASRRITAEVGLRGNPPARLAPERRDVARRAASLLRVGDGWLCATACSRFDDGWCWFDVDGRVTSHDVEPRPEEAVELVNGEAATCRDGGALLTWGLGPVLCASGMELTPIWGVVRRVDRRGDQAGQLDLRGSPKWLRAAPDGRRFVLGLAWGSLLAIDPDDLAHPVEVVPESAGWAPLDWFEFVGPHGALAGDRDTTWWIDTRTWDCARIALPAGVPQASGSARSPDGRHLALMSGTDVTLVAIR